MQNYELTVIVDGKATPAKQKAVQEKITKLVDTFEGKVVKSTDWGKKDLAYPIDKSTAGVYLFFELELESQSVQKLNTKLSMEPDYLRYLLIRKE